MLALARNELIDRRYRIIRWIGQGACATVYEAVDTQLDRSVALKILNTEQVDSTTLQSRFVREAKAAMHIDSPFVVGVFDVGTLEDNRPYIVMEFLEGEDLGHVLDRVECLEEQRAVELAIHVLSGLAHAHKRGVIHRDIKPENLVLVKSSSGDELVKIVDLGISKIRKDTDKEMGLTRTNVVLGSPVYMSPEQCRGAKHMDHRSDVYSVGVVLYECLTGTVPHEADNVNELMFKIALQDAADPRTIKPIEAGLAAIVLKALVRDPDQRFPSASAFREALLEWGATQGARIPPTPSSTRHAPSPRRVRSVDSSGSAPRATYASSQTLAEATDIPSIPPKPSTDRAPVTESDHTPPRSLRRQQAGALAVIGGVCIVVVFVVLLGPWGKAATHTASASASASGSTPRTNVQTAPADTSSGPAPIDTTEPIDDNFADDDPNAPPRAQPPSTRHAKKRHAAPKSSP